VALFGIVVKNAINFDRVKINLNLKNKIPFFDAIVDAGKSRLEAIINHFYLHYCRHIPSPYPMKPGRRWQCHYFRFDAVFFLYLIHRPILFVTLFGRMKILDLSSLNKLFLKQKI